MMKAELRQIFTHANVVVLEFTMNMVKTISVVVADF